MVPRNKMSQPVKPIVKVALSSSLRKEPSSTCCGEALSDVQEVPTRSKPKRKRRKKASTSNSAPCDAGSSNVIELKEEVKKVSNFAQPIKAVAKIPSSREDSSSNWKALAGAQARPVKVRIPPPSLKKQVPEPSPSKNVTAALATSLDKKKQAGSSKPKERAIKKGTLKKLPGEGLNGFGFFNYTHYGSLLTPILTAHKEFMIDTGNIAMDCEMVGVGPMKESALARVSLVNEYGFCLYDKFVKPKLEVTDYRTEFSGIREADLRKAIPFDIAGKQVAAMLKSHILVGHSLKHDFAVLYFTHLKARIRDTAEYFKKVLHINTPALRTLVKKIIGIEIQRGEHSSIVDAQATMALYRLCQKEWEHSVRQKNRMVDIFKETLDEFKALALASPAP